jgi:hypothetical protein
LLLTGTELRIKLEKHLRESIECSIFSGFFTLPAAEWIVRNRPQARQCSIVTRGLPEDFVSGASSLDAIEIALNNGFDIGISTALHAKIYAFEKILYSGSSNLTARGLALIHNSNDELSVEALITDRDRELLNNIWRQSIKIDAKILTQMKQHIDNFNKNLRLPKQISPTWPEKFFKEDRDLYCSDFPQRFPSQDQLWKSTETIMQSPAYRWLEKFIRTHGASSFGKITRQLHHDLYDDPKPYRTDVKTLLYNFLATLEENGKTELIITRPRHSSIVDLKK